VIWTRRSGGGYGGSVQHPPGDPPRRGLGERGIVRGRGWWGFATASAAAGGSDGAGEGADRRAPALPHAPLRLHRVPQGTPRLQPFFMQQLASQELRKDCVFDACSSLCSCWQVGAPPEVASLLEEIGRERCAASAAAGEVGLDPELDEFMVRAGEHGDCLTWSNSCLRSCASLLLHVM
jgi:hypothetical protein